MHSTLTLQQTTRHP